MTVRWTRVAVLGVAMSVSTTLPAVAADLPDGSGFAAPARMAREPGLLPFVQRPYFAEASRYDIYGYPVVLAPPNPLYASTGCPPALQPIYDATGNFAGYHPIQACR